MGFKYLNDAESMAELVLKIKEADKRAYDEFTHTRIEAVFDDRIFVVYKPQGLDGKKHKDPDVVTTIKVLNYACDSQDGSTIEIEDLKTGQRQVLTHVPSRAFDYDLFMCVPVALRLRWDAREGHEGKVSRSLSYATLIKSKNRSDWYSFGVTYAETPNRFREMFPDFNFQLNLY